MGAGNRQLLRATLTLAVLLFAVSISPRAIAQGKVALSPQLVGLDQAFAHGDIEALRELKEKYATNLGPLVDGCIALLAGDLEMVEQQAKLASAMEDQEIRRRGEWLLDTAISWRAVLAATQTIPASEIILRVPIGQVEWGERIGDYAAALVARTRRATGLDSLPTAEVIFLPDIDSLSRVAGIPTARLEDSGTVATTLYGRIFLLSPGAFPNGYAWHIVLSHEAVHDAVQRSIPGKLPHFLEEGIATLLEEWGPYGRLRTLAPMERALLFAAKEHKLLLTEEELNAPYWNLGDGLRARLAFLQALTGALVLQHKGSDRAVAEFFAALAKPGATWTGALRRVADLKESSFRTRMRKRWSKMASREYLPSFLYSDGKQFLSEKGRRAMKEASRTTLLGDLLWGRGHRTAALKMYDRAAAELQPTPELAWRTVRLLIEEELLPEAQARVEATLARHPRDARVQYAAALLYQATGDDELSRQAALDAWLLNPFAEQTDSLMGNTPLKLPVPLKENTP
jgi:hypothetical protein